MAQLRQAAHWSPADACIRSAAGAWPGGREAAGVPRWDPGPSGLRLLRMTGSGWSAVFVAAGDGTGWVGGWDTASKRGTASPSSRGQRGGVPRGGAAAAGGAASRAAAEGARAVPRRDAASLRSGRRQAADASMACCNGGSRAAVGSLGAIRDRGEEALALWPCRRSRPSEARPEGRRRRDPYISERAGSPYPPGACPRAYRAAGARRRADRRGRTRAGRRRTLASGRRPGRGRVAAKRPACPGGGQPLQRTLRQLIGQSDMSPPDWSRASAYPLRWAWTADAWAVGISTSSRTLA